VELNFTEPITSSATTEDEFDGEKVMVGLEKA
jgi:hypothetical protein